MNTSRIRHAVVFLIAVTGFAVSAGAWEPVDTVAVTRATFLIDSHPLELPYFSNRDFAETHPDITRLVISQHGGNRNAFTFYLNLLQAMAEHEGESADVFVLCPQYLYEEDLDAWPELPETVLFWAGMGWYRGDLSTSTPGHPRPASVSSYALADSLVERVRAICPNLETVVLSGNSAGGRFVQGYAIGTLIDSELPELGFLFMHSNPGMYTYIGPERRVGDSFSEFAIPPDFVIDACPGYNDYNWGLEDRNEYMSRVSVNEQRERYRDRHLVVMLGAEDIGPDGPPLQSCEAYLQGENRVERGIIFYNHVMFFYGVDSLATHDRELLAGVGHPVGEVYGHPTARYYLFEHLRPLTGEEPVFVTAGDVDEPLVIPPDGGLFAVPVVVANAAPYRIYGELWSVINGPGGEPVRPVRAWPLEIEANDLLFMTDSGRRIPGELPNAIYRYVVAAGAYPDAVNSSDTLAISKYGGGLPGPYAGPCAGGSGPFAAAAGEIEVEPAYPNPCNERASLRVVLPEPAQLELTVHDVLGRRVTSQMHSPATAGAVVLAIELGGESSGLYLLSVTANGVPIHREKLVLLR